MGVSRAAQHFADELDRLVDRFRQEYEISYPEAVGCLTTKAMLLVMECDEQEEPDGS